MADDSTNLNDRERCLAERVLPRGEAVGNEATRADLSVEQILAWADAHHAAHSAWPAVGPATVSGIVAGAPGESWKAINHALALGLRGLPGDSSLAELLAEHRGAPPPDMSPQALAEKIWAWEQEQFPVKGPKRRRFVAALPALSIDKTLAWADAHEAVTGDWPTCNAGPVTAAPFDVSWRVIDSALRGGYRGLPGGSSLAQLRIEYRDFRPALTVERILAWADAHHAAVGTWPKYDSGKVMGAPGETWNTIDTKLRLGGRGLPGGLSVALLLTEQRGTRYGTTAEPLSVEQILAWADAYHAAHGRWPDYESGLVDPATRETWCAVNSALTVGRRGLPGGTSLARLLIEHRGPEASNRPSKMSVAQVLAWADAHHATTGRWPHSSTGAVAEAPHVTWAKIDRALYHGCRGLPAGASLPELLSKHRGVRNHLRLPNLNLDQILTWIDAFYAVHHHWPVRESGLIDGTRDETWKVIDTALNRGCRGLPGGSSLRGLFKQYRDGAGAPGSKKWSWEQEQVPLKWPKRRARRPCCPRLTIGAILAWADAHHAATGNWPNEGSGRVTGAPFALTWKTIQSALQNGGRGLPGGQSVRSVLVEHRNVGAGRKPRTLTVEQILAWADDYRSKNGRWPSSESGAVADAPGERWSAINSALRCGRYGLPGGTTLLGLIEEHRDPDARLQSTRLTIDQVLDWMDGHLALTGRWPNAQAGRVHHGPPGLTWKSILQSLRAGHRGLPRGWTLARLRAEYRQPRPELTVERILAWADAHHAARGHWPTSRSGRIEETSRETWAIVSNHLSRGGRGLPGGQNLGRFLLEHRGVRAKNSLPPLRIEQILDWADAHYAAHGAWPTDTGKGAPIVEAPGERWDAINRALVEGWRGLPGGTMLSQLLAAHRGTPPRLPAPKLTVDQILAWADEHHAVTGEWPSIRSGVIAGTKGETWSKVGYALVRGNRGLPRLGSLAQLLASWRQVRNHAAPPRLTVEQILAWADAHHAARGRWPTNTSGPVLGAPGETWSAIGAAVVIGLRGLSGGTTLSQLLADHRPTRPSDLTLETIRIWALAHQKATGFLPTGNSGAVRGVPGESWGSIARLMRQGGRGLPVGGKLPHFLLTSCDPCPPRPDTPLTVESILAWAKRHHATTGRWPTPSSGPIDGAPGEEWSRINKALVQGGRGLPGGMKLAELIHRNLDPSLPTEKRKMNLDEILSWADSHRKLMGRWPVITSGAVAAEPGLTWTIINDALRKGYRGVGPGLSLSKLIRQSRPAGPAPIPEEGHEDT